MSEIVNWSASQTVAQLKAGAVSAVEVTEAHLARLEALNPGLNAIVDAVPDALDMARAIDNGTRPKGLLAGAPVTTKINADQKGLANTNGLPGLAGNIAPDDSAVVKNLRDQGAVIIGRTNTPEMSLRWCTSNPLHGVTLNPWDAGITPGGSSGGAASAVASGIGVLAHGNDLGGSVRYPAYACGVVGLRPSRGRIPAYNPSAPMDRPEMTMAMSVQGALGRSVADVQLGIDAMRGYHPGDGNWTSAPGNGRARKAGPLRIGVPEALFSDTPIHSDVADAMRHAQDAAKAAGMELRPVQLPELDRCAELWGQLLFTETETIYADTVAQETSPQLQRWLHAFKSTFECLDLAGYIRAMADRARLQRLWAMLWEDVDMILMPTSLIPPFENDIEFTAPERAPGIIAAQRPLYVINLLGLPGLALPTHVANGVPLGVQLVGPMHDDDAVLAAGRVLEAELGTILDQLPAPYRLAQLAPEACHAS